MSSPLQGNFQTTKFFQNKTIFKSQTQYHQLKMKQQSHHLSIAKQLHHIYPDIQDQLCSRHSTLFGKLRTTFNKLYDNMQPTNYVIVEGNCQIVEQSLTEIKLSMALENGIISLVAKTYPMAQIYVNSNHFGEEVIFSSTGQLQQGLNQLSQQMSSIIKSATSNLTPQQVTGGIFYIHANIPQQQFSYRQAFYMGFFLSVMAINDNLRNFTIRQIIEKMTKLQFIGSRDEIERQFMGYKNNRFSLMLPDLLSLKNQGLVEMEVRNEIMMQEEFQEKQKHHHQTHHAKVQKSHLHIDTSNNFKLVFCRLDLAKQDVQYQLRRRHQISLRKHQLLQQLKEKNEIKGLFELFHLSEEVNLEQISFESQYQRSYQPKSMQELECQQQGEILKQPNQLLQQLLRQVEMVSDFSNEKISLQKLVDQIWQINSQHLKLHSSQVVQLVEDMKQSLQVQSCMLVNRDFLLIVIPKNQFTQLLCEIKHKMNRGELKSKSLFRIEDEDLVVQRWSSGDNVLVGEKIFSSVPAQGVGVFDPSQAIWFD